VSELKLGADFDGETYIPELDKVRLTGMLGRVYEVMKDGNWHTLRQLSEKVRGSEASVSARIRDLRKEKFGGFEVERRRGLLNYSTHYYRLIVGQTELF